MSNTTTKKEGTTITDAILKAVAILGGIWLISKLAGEQRTYYKCPNCNSDIHYKQEQCKNCRIKLKWDF